MSSGNDRISAEERLIARYFSPLAKHPGAFGLSDDAAVLAPPMGHDLVLTTDGVVAGVHFFPGDPAADVARKVLRMNLSDLAAKGAQPVGFLMSLALPAATKKSWMARFAKGLGEDSDHYGCSLLGGDTDRTGGPLSIVMMAFGAVPHGRIVRRSTAKPGDIIVVTGTIGDAALGVKLRRTKSLAKTWRLTRAMARHLEERYLLPQPRNALAAAVLRYASAAMDVSDGLAGDLAKLCRASAVAAEVDVASVPLSIAARAAIAAKPKLLERVLTGGDDYEIVLALSPARLAALHAASKKAGVPVTEIGRLRKGRGVRFLRSGNTLDFSRASYSHF